MRNESNTLVQFSGVVVGGFWMFIHPPPPPQWVRKKFIRNSSTLDVYTSDLAVFSSLDQVNVFLLFLLFFFILFFFMKLAKKSNFTKNFCKKKYQKQKKFLSLFYNKFCLAIFFLTSHFLGISYDLFHFFSSCSSGEAENVKNTLFLPHETPPPQCWSRYATDSVYIIKKFVS